MRKKILVTLLLLLVFSLNLTACTDTPDAPACSESVEYKIDKVYMGIGYNPSTKSDLEYPPELNYPEDIKQQINLDINDKTYTLDFLWRNGDILSYQSSGYADLYISYDIYEKTGTIARLDLTYPSFDRVEVFGNPSDEAEYLRRVYALFLAFGISDLDTYELEYKEDYLDSSPEEPYNYTFRFVRYVNGIKTDDECRLIISDNGFFIMVSRNSFAEFNAVFPSDDELLATADAYLLNSLNDGWIFDPYEYVDRTLMHYYDGSLCIEYYYHVTPKNTKGEYFELKTYNTVYIFLK